MNKKAEIKNRIDLINRGEVPEGYKKVHGYIIPNDWQVTRFNKIFERITQKNDVGCENVLTISAQYGLINQQEFFKKSIASADTSNYFLLNKNDFAYNKSYSAGYPFGTIKKMKLYEQGIVSPLYICFRAKSKLMDIDYIEQYFDANKFNPEILAIAQEGARNHGLLNMSIEDFFNCNIVKPSQQEQEKIAKILNCCDKIIELKQKLLVEIINIKKYIVDKILIKNAPKDKVQEVKLKDISRVITKGTTPNRFENHSDIKFIKIESIVNGKIDNSKCSHISRNIHDNELSRSKLQESDILFGIAGALGVCAKVEKKNLPANTNQALAIIRLNDINSIDYVIEVLKSPIMKKYIYINNAGCAQVNLNLEQISNFKFKLPCKFSQILIIKLLKNMNKKIELLTQEIEQYKQLKKSLSQLLLTGIVRTVEVDCEN